MSKANDTINKAYGNIPKEPLISLDFNFVSFRGIKFYWLMFLRKIQGR
jgi:hypothetical protein